MPTPLYDRLTAVAAGKPLRFDMPGHHAAPLPAQGIACTELDFTETGRTGDLYGAGGDAIEAAEALWAEAAGFSSCLFLTGGSTQGIHAGLALLAGVDGAVALDRGSHRSAYNALALLGLTPRYLSRPWLPDEGVAGPISPAEVERALQACPEIKTVCIVSPTYYGVLSDVPAIAKVCHEHGARLLVDGAHGAHLPFLGYEGYRDADVAVLSAHKTLPALGQSALLLANGFPMDELRRFGAVYGSSSPSYLLMASLDTARDYMLGEGRTLSMMAGLTCSHLRKRLPALRPGPGLSLDPLRLTVKCGDGFALGERLRERNIFPEMADRCHVTFILTAADTPQKLARLSEALTELLTDDPPAADFNAYAPPPPPEMAMSPRAALFAPRRSAAFSVCAGEIAAEQLAPYPPGVPVVAPGERITKEHLAYLEKIGYQRAALEVVAGEGGQCV